MGRSGLRQGLQGLGSRVEGLRFRDQVHTAHSVVHPGNTDYSLVVDLLSITPSHCATQTSRFPKASFPGP